MSKALTSDIGIERNDKDYHLLSFEPNDRSLIGTRSDGPSLLIVDQQGYCYIRTMHTDIKKTD